MYTEIVLIALLFLFAGYGYRKGFVFMAFQLAASVFAFLAANAASKWLIVWFQHSAPGHDASVRFFSFLIVFFLVERLLGFIFRLLAKVLNLVAKLPVISCTNSLLGIGLGFLEGIIVLGSSIYLILMFHLEPHLVLWLSQSNTAHFIERLFYPMLGYLL